MNEILLLIIFLYYVMAGTVGGFALYLSYDNAYINLWKSLRKNYNIIGCILVYIIIHPAILLTLEADIFYWVLGKLFELFEFIFKKGE